MVGSHCNYETTCMICEGLHNQRLISLLTELWSNVCWSFWGTFLKKTTDSYLLLHRHWQTECFVQRNYYSDLGI